MRHLSTQGIFVISAMVPPPPPPGDARARARAAPGAMHPASRATALVAAVIASVVAAFSDPCSAIQMRSNWSALRIFFCGASQHDCGASQRDCGASEHDCSEHDCGASKK